MTQQKKKIFLQKNLLDMPFDMQTRRKQKIEEIELGVLNW